MSSPAPLTDPALLHSLIRSLPATLSPRSGDPRLRQAREEPPSSEAGPSAAQVDVNHDPLE